MIIFLQELHTLQILWFFYLIISNTLTDDINRRIVEKKNIPNYYYFVLKVFTGKFISSNKISISVYWALFSMSDISYSIHK